MFKPVLITALALIVSCHKPSGIESARLADKDWQRPQQISHADQPKPAWLLIFDGDSITVGHGLKPAQSYPQQVVKVLHERGENIDAFNLARCWDRMPDLFGRTDHMDALKVSHHYIRSVLVAWAGTNDIAFGRSPEETAKAIREYTQDREKHGFVVHFLAPLRRGPDFAAFEPKRVKLMGILPNLTDIGNIDLSDSIHPSAAGSLAVSRVVGHMIY